MNLIPKFLRPVLQVAREPRRLTVLELQMRRRAIDRMVEEDIRRQRETNPLKRVFQHYWALVDGVLVPQVYPNLVPTQGLNDMLGVWLANGTQTPTWYQALYANAVAPALTWTAANWVATAGEITSQVTGYTGANRPAFVPNAAAAGVIDSVGHEASYSIVSATTVTVNGVALCSVQGRGATTGILASASQYPSPFVLNNGSTFESGYRETVANA